MLRRSRLQGNGLGRSRRRGVVAAARLEREEAALVAGEEGGEGVGVGVGRAGMVSEVNERGGGYGQ